MSEPGRAHPRHRLIGIALAVLAAHALLLGTVAQRSPAEPLPRAPTPAGPLMVSWQPEAAARPAAPTLAQAAAAPTTPDTAPPAALPPAPAAVGVPQSESTPPETTPVAAATTVTEEAVQLAQAAPRPVPAPAPAAALPPAEVPPSVQLDYEVVGQARGFDYRASGALEWRRDGDAYEARMALTMPLLGSRVQTSRGAVGPEGLRPERFGDKRSSERATHFEREAGRIRFSSNAPDAILLPGAQDRLSLFLQLAGLLRARPHREGEAIEFQVAGTGDAETWRFEVGALQTLDLPAGAIEARRLLRSARKPNDTTVEVWLAPALGHLPVRLRVTQTNGDVADQRLARLP